MKARVIVPMMPTTVAEPARHGRLGGEGTSVMRPGGSLCYRIILSNVLSQSEFFAHILQAWQQRLVRHALVTGVSVA